MNKEEMEQKSTVLVQQSEEAAKEYSKNRMEGTALKKKTERFVYCGPNLPGGMLMRFTVYKGGIPDYVKNLMQDCPEMELLMVSPDALQQTRQDIETQGTAAHIAYKAVVDFIKKGGVHQ